MSEEKPLQRAHALSAEASILLKNPDATTETLEKAVSVFRQAADLFEKSAGEIQGNEEKKTLQLLTTQHRKMARDVERRISIGQRNAVRQETVASSSASGSYRTNEAMIAPNGAGRGMGSPRRENVGLASANVGNFTTGLGSRITSGLGMPPFALRPGMQQQQQQHHPPFARAVTSPPSTTTTSISHIPTVPGPNPNMSLVSAGGGDIATLSPLHSSSSSDESYLNLGAIPDTLDPFSRFWGMLENMLDDISNPVIFASAPLGIGENVNGGNSNAGTIDRTRKRDRARIKGKGRERQPSPSESFYVVPSQLPASRRENGKSDEEDKEALSPQNTPASLKTPEELVLENENLRASLDALALHAQDLERSNKTFREQAEERDKMMRSVVVGMRREAQKVKHGQDMMRSQLLAASVTLNSPRNLTRAADEGRDKGDSEHVQSLRKRIRELEEEVKNLKGENEKQKSQVEKYRDRFHQLKINARAKKEAKVAGNPSTGSTKSSSGTAKKLTDMDEPE